MAKNIDFDAKEIEARVHDLSKSMEQIKTRTADRDDVVVELKQSERTRLELLVRDLQSVFDQVPDDNDQFEFALTKGETPRLWIDMSAYVRMGSDRRQYELIKDTRMGRTVLASFADMNQIGNAVTEYIADKIIERERLIEGEWVAMKGYDFDAKPDDESVETVIVRKGGFWQGLFWMLFGIIFAVGGLFAWAWFGQLPSFLN